MNFSLYFENFLYNSSSDKYTNFIIRGRLVDNSDPIGARQNNTKWLANGSTIKTDFILVDKTDLIKFFNYKIDGERQRGFRIPKAELKGTYLRSPNPGGNVMNQDNGDDVGEYYFLIGRVWIDYTIIEYLINSNLI
jgi:hypothetical protein